MRIVDRVGLEIKKNRYIVGGALMMLAGTVLGSEMFNTPNAGNNLFTIGVVVVATSILSKSHYNFK